MTLEDAIRDLARVAASAYTAPASVGSRKAAARRFTDPGQSALEVFLAARILLGSDFTEYEPETIWLELGDVAPINRDKLMASIALANRSSFYVDWRTFGNTALAFNSHAVHPDTIPQPSPEELAWTVYEAELLFALTDRDDLTPFFSDECAVFAASVLHYEGLVIPPAALDFSAEELTRLVLRDSGNKNLIKKVEDAWGKLNKEDVDKKDFDDDDLGVQLSHQADVYTYIRNRAREAVKGLRDPEK